MYYDAISGEALGGDLTKQERIVEMETLRKHGVYEKAPTKEHWENAGTGPAGAKRADTNEGDKENPEHRCRLVAKEIQRDRARALVCGGGAAGGQEDVARALGEHAGNEFGLHRRGLHLLSRDS